MHEGVKSIVALEMLAIIRITASKEHIERFEQFYIKWLRERTIYQDSLSGWDEMVGVCMLYGFNPNEGI